MGACDFSTMQLGKFKTARIAYSNAVKEAEYDEGHDPYNGTISTCDGFYTRTDNPRYGTAAFDKWESKMLDQIDKRDCYCIEITGAVLKRMKERRGLKGKKGIRAYYFFGMAAC
jgi:uridine phosphorylase